MNICYLIVAACNLPDILYLEGYLFLVLQVILNSFSLYSLPCPGGYAMTSPSDSEAATCTCVTTVEEILFCEDDQDSIILEVSDGVMVKEKGLGQCLSRGITSPKKHFAT